jgi:hypothetical protein
MRSLLPLALAACLATAGWAWASPPDGSATWTQLSPQQKQALAPLERDWAQIDPQRRAKWLVVADRLPTLPADERARLQARMHEWARMTPAERSRARLQFQEAQQVSPSDRQAKWQAYQALPEAERQALKQSAKPASKPAVKPNLGAEPKAAGPGTVAGSESAKKNLVQATPSPRARVATSTTQQNRPGATTTPMTTARALPPVHNQAGMPKIAATPGFVDPATMLPKRGPQGAAVRSAAAISEPPSRP